MRICSNSKGLAQTRLHYKVRSAFSPFFIALHKFSRNGTDFLHTQSSLKYEPLCKHGNLGGLIKKHPSLSLKTVACNCCRFASKLCARCCNNSGRFSRYGGTFA